jgi:hypothetical protein
MTPIAGRVKVTGISQPMVVMTCRIPCPGAGCYASARRGAHLPSHGLPLGSCRSGSCGRRELAAGGCVQVGGTDRLISPPEVSKTLGLSSRRSRRRRRAPSQQCAVHDRLHGGLGPDRGTAAAYARPVPPHTVQVAGMQVCVFPSQLHPTAGPGCRRSDELLAHRGPGPWKIFLKSWPMSFMKPWPISARTRIE